jgi:hypothetical protein
VARIENPPRELNPRQVLLRFGIRIGILTAFAAFGSVDFGRSLVALLAMSAILCSVVAAIRREAAFSYALNHWDEAVIYAALYFLCAASSLSSPG